MKSEQCARLDVLNKNDHPSSATTDKPLNHYCIKIYIKRINHYIVLPTQAVELHLLLPIVACGNQMVILVSKNY